MKKSKGAEGTFERGIYQPRIQRPPATEGGSDLARRLVAGPRTGSIAENGMRAAIAIRVSQLLTLARVQIRERLLERMIEQSTDDARERQQQSATVADDPRDHAQAIRAAGFGLGEHLARTLFTYAREYDADDNDRGVLEDCRLFCQGVIEGLLRFAKIE